MVKIQTNFAGITVQVIDQNSIICTEITVQVNNYDSNKIRGNNGSSLQFIIQTIARK